MIKDTQAIVLAAGRSTRFNTNRSKLLEKICGQEMILFPIKLLESLQIPISMVVGFQKEELQKTIKEKTNWKIDFIHQEVQKGTGHAVECTKNTWTEKNILILNGDCPLITSDIIENLYKKHADNDADITFVTAHNFDPAKNGYGKVITQDGVLKIVEAKDWHSEINAEECCVNAGIYLVKKEFLERSIEQIKASSVTGEFYLTELVELASKNKLKVELLDAPFDRIRGVNNFHELWAAEHLQRSEMITNFMQSGVRFDIPNHVHIDIGVEVEAGTNIAPGVLLKGKTKVGKNCNIHAFTILENTTIEDNVDLKSHVIIKNSYIKSNATIGEFAYIHSNSLVGNNSVVGHFVEAKNASLGNNTKAKHLSYLGDAIIGNNVNIGAGTITANYDGHKKNTTEIKDNSFIGSNTSLVAPVTLGKNSFTAAGSVITDEIPDNAFAIARSKQVNKENYAEKYSKKKENEQEFIINKEIQNTDNTTL